MGERSRSKCIGYGGCAIQIQSNGSRLHQKSRLSCRLCSRTRYKGLPAPCVDLVSRGWDSSWVFCSAVDSRNLGVWKSMYGLWKWSFICIAVPKLTILSSSPGCHHARICWAKASLQCFQTVLSYRHMISKACLRLQIWELIEEATAWGREVHEAAQEERHC